MKLLNVRQFTSLIQRGFWVRSLGGVLILGMSSLAQAATLNFDVDGFAAPIGETQSGFTRMTESSMVGNGVNGSVTPTVTESGVTVTAQGDGFRDRNTPPGTSDRLREVDRDFIFSLTAIQISISGLAAGFYDVTSFHSDWNIDSNLNPFDIIVSDDLGSDRVVANDIDSPPVNLDYLGVSYIVSSNGLDDVLIDIVAVAPVFNGVRFGGISINPVPVPAAVWLFGSALIGLAGFSKRKKTA